ncbi:putative MAPEG superfamily protein [Chromobacterium alkanivorans]|uniref:MAPEG family protein n=1 Tax=Chromobacterium TaxID=535 RepID=UPI00065416B7|nr:MULTISPECIES: MAPEG family protein [Chromobacterium]KMN82166.1 transmembrane protein [Chromobacterium sp. LK11]MBN3003324.1 MAPEG family protein [Chromobacterium alkanivorans]MCS3804137.1 putative MAPEG superfamily protein [Chromobacterium alkanivorans]MCS3818642.1 putative MAPEG superfamily protein [Chromobacterium alkanivorans]MCS3873423.1 putative MAPEG superfamily protein [Chromobacterium alkanivorans]
MPFALWSILLAALLPLIWAGVTKAGARMDNHKPREALAQASGYRLRANWAQQNAWEALPTYAAAVLVGWAMHVPQAFLDAAAGVFIVARVAHGLLYLADQASLRSLSWLIGLLTVVAIFCKAGGVF